MGCMCLYIMFSRRAVAPAAEASGHQAAFEKKPKQSVPNVYSEHCGEGDRVGLPEGGLDYFSSRSRARMVQSRFRRVCALE